MHRRGCFHEPHNETYQFIHFGSTYELDNNTFLALTAHVLIAIGEEPRYTLGEVSDGSGGGYWGISHPRGSKRRKRGRVLGDREESDGGPRWLGQFLIS